VGGVLVAVALVGFVLVAVSRSAREEDPGEILGVQTFNHLSREHVTTPVSYPQNPPVGGDHSPTLQPCGPYREPVPNEQAVHSMEHGAVWVTFRPDLPAADVERLMALADQTYVIVSPVPDLPAPVIASAWRAQLRLERADDPRLKSFLATYRQGPQTPEPGAACPPRSNRG